MPLTWFSVLTPYDQACVLAAAAFAILGLWSFAGFVLGGQAGIGAVLAVMICMVIAVVGAWMAIRGFVLLIGLF